MQAIATRPTVKSVKPKGKTHAQYVQDLVNIAFEMELDGHIGLAGGVKLIVRGAVLVPLNMRHELLVVGRAIVQATARGAHLGHRLMRVVGA